MLEAFNKTVVITRFEHPALHISITGGALTLTKMKEQTNKQTNKQTKNLC
jgi:hypothetical protein